MSDSPPARPKPGSLRDRIKAFENQASQSAPAPPPPRPKPAGLHQWKPTQPSPQRSVGEVGAPGAAAADTAATIGTTAAAATSPATAALAVSSTGGSSMSASDARDSIRQGGSLKERMAALQGKGAFGGGGASSPPAPLVPPPAANKPKWKSPVPVPVSPPPPVAESEKNEKEIMESVTEEEEEKEGKGEVTTVDKTPEDVAASATTAAEESTEIGQEPDQEDEERQRRAAIAARMARLGGTRLGMGGPPVGRFGAAPPPKPPVAKKPEVKKEEADDTTSTAITTTDNLEAVDQAEPVTEPVAEIKTAEIVTETATSPISSPPLSHSRSSPQSMPAPAVPRRTAPPRRKPPKSPLPPPPDAESTAEVEAAVAEAQERQEALHDVLSNVEPLTKEEKRELEVPPVEEVETMETLTAETNIEKDDEEVEARKVEDEDVPKEPEESVPVAATQVEEPTDAEEEEEEARRKRIAEKLAKMGGINPLYAPPPKRTPSTDTSPSISSPLSSPPPPPPPFRRSSVDSVRSIGAGPYRRTSVDSVKEPELGLGPAKELVVGGIPEQEEKDDERDEKVDEREEEEDEESNDAMAASVIFERPSSLNQGYRGHHEDQENIEHDSTAPLQPPPPPLSYRGSSGFVTRPPPDDDEQEEQEGRESPPPLPVSPRIATLAPRAASLRHRWTEEAEGGQDESFLKKVSVRPMSVRSVQSEVSQYSQDEEAEQGDDHEVQQKDEEDSDTKYVPPPPTRRVPLPPPPPVPKDGEHDAEPDHKQGSTPLSAQSDAPLVIPPPTVGRRYSKDDDPLSDMPLPHPILVRQSQAPVVRIERAEKEVMDDEEGDPIDPSFHSPKVLAQSPQVQPSPHIIPHDVESGERKHGVEVEKEKDQEGPGVLDLEAVRRKTIAERVAKLGGLKFGAAPVPVLPARLPPAPSAPVTEFNEEEEKAAEDKTDEQREAVDEEEEERARKERIAAKLAGMGGMRIGMMPQGMMGIPPRPTQRPQDPLPPAAPSRVPPPPRTPTSPHDAESEPGSTTTSDDGVKVEVEPESEIEEVYHEDARMEDGYEDTEIVSPPPPPPRVQRQASLTSSPPQKARPPVPSTANVKRTSVGSLATVPVPIAVPIPPPRRRASSGSTSATTTTTGSHSSRPVKKTSEYVMVEEPHEYDEVPPPPPTRLPQQRTAPSHPPPPPPPPSAVSDSISSQWELPSIPTEGLGLLTTSEMDWTDTMDESLPRSTPKPEFVSKGASSYPPGYTPTPRPGYVPPSAPSASPEQLKLSSDDLVAIWGRVGVQVCEVAATLYEKSKKSVVGEGTYASFVQTVLKEVPNAVQPSSGGESQWGYLIYAQSGSAVQRRSTEIMPGDVIELIDARFKGHRGLQTYTQHMGVGGEPLVGVVTEYEPKKSKVKVLQANQHVGQQTVESASYRLEDLKSGVLKVYRVLEAQ